VRRDSIAGSSSFRAVLEAIFVGASLFEAAVWFLGGLLLGGIGLAFFVDFVRFRRRAVTMRVRILGVIGKKQGKKGHSIYWPVYEYMNGAGDLIRTRASASGSLAKNLPGAFRDVRVDSDDPHDVRGLAPAGMLLRIAFLAAGAGLFAISNTVNDDMGLVTLVAIALVGALRRRGVNLDPRGEAER